MHLMSCPCGAKYVLDDMTDGDTIKCKCSRRLTVRRRPTPPRAVPKPAAQPRPPQAPAPLPDRAPAPGREAVESPRGDGPAPLPIPAPPRRHVAPFIVALAVAAAVAVVLLGGAALLNFPVTSGAGAAPSAEFEPFPQLPAETRPLAGSTCIAVNRVGDARQRFQICFDEKTYAAVKTMPHSFYRRLGLGKVNWMEIQDLKIETDDAIRTLRFTWETRGFARPNQDGVWELPLNGNDLTPRLLRDHEAIFDASFDSALGVVRNALYVTLPSGSTNLRVGRDKDRLQFQMPHATGPEGTHAAAEFVWDVKPQLMGCLAKLYGKRQFNDMWAARAVFRNTGDRSLNDYRIRFRLQDYTRDWSPWRETPRVLPGQTIVDPFYPSINLDKLVHLEGVRELRLEVHYSYRCPGKGLVERTEEKTIKLLGRCEVIYSNVPKADRADDFRDGFENIPIVLASFCTYQDPVIQQAAGWVSELAGGANSSGSVEGALSFLEALYDFLAVNVAYMTPPGGAVDALRTQHIKYGRDVLRNRAGTCIDLAILYGSVCQAVGLRPVLVIIPGHCFPAVRLPNGEGVASVETTLIGKGSFSDALKVGKKEWEAALNGPHFLVDVGALQSLGVDGLDLSPLGGTLTEWGVEKRRGRAERGQAKAAPTAPSTPPAPRERSILGLWKASGTENGAASDNYLHFQDGKRWTQRLFNWSALRQEVYSGTYDYDGKTGRLTFNNTEGRPIEVGDLIWDENGEDGFSYTPKAGKAGVVGRTREYRRAE